MREGKATEPAINPPIVLSAKCHIFMALCNSDRRKPGENRTCSSAEHRFTAVQVWSQIREHGMGWDGKFIAKQTRFFLLTDYYY